MDDRAWGMVCNIFWGIKMKCLALLCQWLCIWLGWALIPRCEGKCALNAGNCLPSLRSAWRTVTGSGQYSYCIIDRSVTTQ